mmetsp:Transcript_110975/g.192153  ORF Transcript_110975/g.192153 Transcript_110975/m.192153 type:complete len:210 (-) Transcript_110975:1039-1668(-)
MNTMDAILLAAQVRQSQTLFSTFCLKLMENPKTANVKITKPEPLRERNQYEGNVCGSTISLNEKCDKFVEFVALVVLAVVVLTEFVALVVLTVVGLTAVELTADSLVELPGVKLAAVELSASSSGPLFLLTFARSILVRLKVCWLSATVSSLRCSVASATEASSALMPFSVAAISSVTVAMLSSVSAMLVSKSARLCSVALILSSVSSN